MNNRCKKILRGLCLTPGCLLLLSCNGKPSAPAPVEVTASYQEALTTEPGAAIWAQAPVFETELLPQDVVEPRQLLPSTAKMRIQAITDGKQIAFRLSWPDQSKNDRLGVREFSDACAIQLPREISPDVPDPQMGEPAKLVEITYWRAAWQSAGAAADNPIQAIYPNATVDHYPFEAAHLAQGSPEQQAMALRYAPAKAQGNWMAKPPDKFVQDLIAGGAGTLTPAEKNISDGQGRYVESGWEVVLSRPLPAGLTRGQRSVVAVAVWQGENREVGSKKMRSVWIPLYLEQ